MSEHISLDGFHLTDLTDEGRWNFDDLTGWRGGASVRVAQVPRTGHGLFAQQGQRGGRLITISGWFFGQSRRAAADASTQLEALLADGSFGELVIHDPDLGSRQATVQLADVTDVRWKDSHTLRYQLTLLAPDAFLYGPEQSVSTGFAMPPAGGGLVFPEVDGFVDFGPPVAPASVVLDNPGSAAAWPRFAVAGAVNGFRVFDVTAGVPVDYVRALAEGQSVSIDMKTGRATRGDGEDVTTSLRLPSLLSIPAYSQREYLFEPLTAVSAAVLTASVRPTYN